MLAVKVKPPLLKIWLLLTFLISLAFNFTSPESDTPTIFPPASFFISPDPLSAVKFKLSPEILEVFKIRLPVKLTDFPSILL
jgi:hypothetical protein